MAEESKSLALAVQARGLDIAQWSTLANSLFPGAKPESILMAVDYCRARKLDPLKKPCHIVPVKVKNARTDKYEWRDVVMPGIYEYRTTAQRTGQYMGRSRFEYGPEIEAFGVKAPEWVEVTVYRWHPGSGQKIEFPTRVLFREVCATNFEGKANQRWAKAPVQMAEKCAEAAALRAAFPDELGGEHTVEEIEGRTLDAMPVAPATEAPESAEPAPAEEPVEPAAQSAVINAGQLKLLTKKLADAGIDHALFGQEFGVPGPEALPFDRLNDALAWVKTRAA